MPVGVSGIEVIFFCGPCVCDTYGIRNIKLSDQLHVSVVEYKLAVSLQEKDVTTSHFKPTVAAAAAAAATTTTTTTNTTAAAAAMDCSPVPYELMFPSL